ncbi:MAG: glycosyltransferase family 39 protein [Pyrinomonadaceae bacterium]
MTKTEDQRSKTGRFVWIAFAVIIVAVYFFGLTIPLIGPDEPRYAQIAREMFERNDPVTPTLGGFGWFEKPALLYWLEIVSYRIFGVSEFAARFGSALFGLGTIFCLWLLGKNIRTSDFKSADEIRNPKSEIQNPNSWLALIAASNIGLLSFSRGASFDIILTFPMTAALVAFFIFDRHDRKNPITYHLSLVTFYFFVGVALLAKGLIGIVFPFGIVAFYYLLSWKWPNRTFIISLFWGTVVTLLVASAWYLPMYRTNGWKFIDEFFIQHHFQRYTSNKYQHPQPFWFFWVVLPLMTIPWLPFFLASVWDFVRKSFHYKEPEAPKKESEASKEDGPSESRTFYILPFSERDPLLRFALAWMLVPLLFFSASGSKLPGYILPALPAACVFTAEYVCRFVRKSKLRVVALQTLAFITFAVVAALLQFVMPRIAYEDSVKGLIRTANQRGFTAEQVLNLHTVSHNAEFYAAGRLVRDADGGLKKFLGPAEIVQQMRKSRQPQVLVLIPPEFLPQLTESDLFETAILDQNGELAIVLVKLKGF